MSHVGDAAAGLVAAASEADDVARGLAALRSGLDDLYATYTVALGGSSRPEVDSALALIRAAIYAIDEARGRLASGSHAIRSYVTDVLQVGSAAAGIAVERPAQALPRLHGVHDPDNLFSPKEREIADFLAARGASVRPLPADHTKIRRPNPDAAVILGPGGSEIVTEFKTLDEPTHGAVKGRVLEAGAQLRNVSPSLAVVDGRKVGLSDEVARRGLARAAGQARQHGQPLPERVLVILPDNRTIEWGG